MKKYIKPELYVVNVLVENNILNTSIGFYGTTNGTGFSMNAGRRPTILDDEDEEDW